MDPGVGRCNPSHTLLDQSQVTLRRVGCTLERLDEKDPRKGLGA